MGYSSISRKGLLYAPPHRHDSTYHSFCCTSFAALIGMTNSSMVHYEGSTSWPDAPWLFDGVLTLVTGMSRCSVAVWRWAHSCYRCESMLRGCLTVCSLLLQVWVDAPWLFDGVLTLVTGVSRCSVAVWRCAHSCYRCESMLRGCLTVSSLLLQVWVDAPWLFDGVLTLVTGVSRCSVAVWRCAHSCYRCESKLRGCLTVCSLLLQVWVDAPWLFDGVLTLVTGVSRCSVAVWRWAHSCYRCESMLRGCLTVCSLLLQVWVDAPWLFDGVLTLVTGVSRCSVAVWRCAHSCYRCESMLRGCLMVCSLLLQVWVGSVAVWWCAHSCYRCESMLRGCVTVCSLLLQVWVDAPHCLFDGVLTLVTGVSRCSVAVWRCAHSCYRCESMLHRGCLTVCSLLLQVWVDAPWLFDGVLTLVTGVSRCSVAVWRCAHSCYRCESMLHRGCLMVCSLLLQVWVDAPPWLFDGVLTLVTGVSRCSTVAVWRCALSCYRCESMLRGCLTVCSLLLQVWVDAPPWLFDGVFTLVTGVSRCSMAVWRCAHSCYRCESMHRGCLMVCSLLLQVWVDAPPWLFDGVLPLVTGVSRCSTVAVWRCAHSCYRCESMLRGCLTVCSLLLQVWVDAPPWLFDGVLTLVTGVSQCSTVAVWRCAHSCYRCESMLRGCLTVCSLLLQVWVDAPPWLFDGVLTLVTGVSRCSVAVWRCAHSCYRCESMLHRGCLMVCSLLLQVWVDAPPWLFDGVLPLVTGVSRCSTVAVWRCAHSCYRCESMLRGCLTVCSLLLQVWADAPWLFDGVLTLVTGVSQCSTVAVWRCAHSCYRCESMLRGCLMVCSLLLQVWVDAPPWLFDGVLTLVTGVSQCSTVAVWRCAHSCYRCESMLRGCLTVCSLLLQVWVDAPPWLFDGVLTLVTGVSRCSMAVWQCSHSCYRYESDRATPHPEEEALPRERLQRCVSQAPTAPCRVGEHAPSQDQTHTRSSPCPTSPQWTPTGLPNRYHM